MNQDMRVIDLTKCWITHLNPQRRSSIVIRYVPTALFESWKKEQLDLYAQDIVHTEESFWIEKEVFQGRFSSLASCADPVSAVVISQKGVSEQRETTIFWHDREFTCFEEHFQAHLRKDPELARDVQIQRVQGFYLTADKIEKLIENNEEGKRRSQRLPSSQPVVNG